MWCKSFGNVQHAILYLFESDFSLHLNPSMDASLRMFWSSGAQMQCALLDFNALAGTFLCLNAKKQQYWIWDMM